MIKKSKKILLIGVVFLLSFNIYSVFVRGNTLLRYDDLRDDIADFSYSELYDLIQADKLDTIIKELVEDREKATILSESIEESEKENIPNRIDIFSIEVNEIEEAVGFIITVGEKIDISNISEYMVFIFKLYAQRNIQVVFEIELEEGNISSQEFSVYEDNTIQTLYSDDIKYAQGNTTIIAEVPKSYLNPQAIVNITYFEVFAIYTIDEKEYKIDYISNTANYNPFLEYLPFIIGIVIIIFIIGIIIIIRRRRRRLPYLQQPTRRQTYAQYVGKSKKIEEKK